ncbi:hypothetical protein SAMN05216421_1695 [Halopseudomonas xinjiangensis]|uniref:Uncharacterized protein n=1 Tax=Halopseudomonas xinjiangensis TaxID=487184 RepID=A0A1H1SYM8_9GAMM|nr:hypothetical protein SAMN05216421_1695 [Halopseudomonas xinjiangensis]
MLVIEDTPEGSARTVQAEENYLVTHMQERHLNTFGLITFSVLAYCLDCE